MRVDICGRAGLTIGPRYDSLLAKVITHLSGTAMPAAVRKARTALAEFSVDGLETNIGLLREVLSDGQFHIDAVTTGWLGQKLPELVSALATDQSGSGDVVPEVGTGEDVVYAAHGGDGRRGDIAQRRAGSDEDAACTGDDAAAESVDALDLDRCRGDLDEVAHRHQLTRDVGRTLLPSGTGKIGAPPGRTSPIWSTPASSSTVRRRWRCTAPGVPRRI